ncbi:MAG: hypothetical protein NT031_18220 [Planctomycetota bacterium]|nr:hypothetical protein [Planctomycetota bacterium]
MTNESHGKTFVGFGFGPIQSGLFLYEAARSGRFDRLVVAEVDQMLVDAVRAAGHCCRVNVAGPDGVDVQTIEGVELYNPSVPADRVRLVAALAAGDEMATALPSVNVYDAGGAASVTALLAEGLRARTREVPTILYAAENHNHAAEILPEKLARALGQSPADVGFQALNTVIGKMSGVIAEPRVIKALSLATLTDAFARAVLVEQFNRILISRVRLPGFVRGIEAFQEKADLLPFEEAKLYGHNAVHALLAYLAERAGYVTIAQAGRDAELMATARRAFLDECGPGLIHKHAATGDELFTPAGWGAYAEDLLVRMVNPHLADRTDRVARDHARKLGWDDRLFGAMRLAEAAGAEPANLARGAAAGVLSLIRRQHELRDHLPALPADEGSLTPASLERFLLALWRRPCDDEARRMIDLTARALPGL